MLDKAFLGANYAPIQYPSAIIRRVGLSMLSIPKRFATTWAAICLVVVVAIGNGRADAQTPSLGELDQLMAAGQWEQAASVARSLDEDAQQQADPQLDLTLPFARLAHSLERGGKKELAAEFYQRSIDASTRPAAAALPAGKTILLRLAAGSLLTDTGRLSQAVTAIEPLLEPENSLPKQQQQAAVSIALRIGATALSKSDHATAATAYSMALNHADQGRRATAMLGDAWVTALQGDDPLAAAEKLATFVEQFPEHSDAAQVARAGVEYYRRAGNDRAANELQATLLKTWPESASARALVHSHCQANPQDAPESVGRWLIDAANVGSVDDFSASMTSVGILAATQQDELTAWANLVNHLAETDQSGQATSDLLVALVDSGNEAEAERLATMLIAPLEETVATAGVREAACRWAGRTLRWSMLAFASESESPGEPTANRSIAVETLFAEALMQMGRIDDARAWWDYLVDERKVTRFSTLLRSAEAETAVGFDADLASQRVSAARRAAGADRFNLSLVDLLDAELAIRRTKFDRARGLLENVIRSSEADPSVRGRAQWLIGETHYLQQQFHEAIEAYRLVEGIDPKGEWVSLSILQAGKSFEQLGRTREAAVCYGNLLKRFSGSSHAEHARRRLGSIHPETNSPEADSSPRSIRR